MKALQYRLPKQSIQQQPPSNNNSSIPSHQFTIFPPHVRIKKIHNSINLAKQTKQRTELIPGRALPLLGEGEGGGGGAGEKKGIMEGARRRI